MNQREQPPGRSPFLLGRNWLVMKGIMQGMQMQLLSILTASASIRRWPMISVMISRPVHADIGFFTKSPGLSTKSPIAPKDVYIGWLPNKVRLVGQHDRRQLQLDSGKVMRPPSPGNIPGEIPDEVKEGWVMESRCEGYPPRFVNVVREIRRMPEYLVGELQSFPQRAQE